jgi:hypothetical protein
MDERLGNISRKGRPPRAVGAVSAWWPLRSGDCESAKVTAAMRTPRACSATTTYAAVSPTAKVLMGVLSENHKKSLARGMMGISRL